MDWKDGYLKRAALAKRIRQTLAQEHGLNTSDILINFLTNWRLVKYPTGLIEKHAYIVVRAPDYKPTRFSVSQARDERWTMHTMGPWIG